MDPTSLWVIIMCISLLKRTAAKPDNGLICQYDDSGSPKVNCEDLSIPNQCAPDWSLFTFNGKCYPNDNEKSWEDARTYCEEQGTELAAVRSKQEIALFLLQRKHSGSIWLNGEKEGLKWVWKDKEAGEFKWIGSNGNTISAPSGNGQCVSLDLTNQKMSSAECKDKKQFLCVTKKRKAVGPKVPACGPLAKACQSVPVVVVITVAVVLFLQLMALLTCTALPVLWLKFKNWRKNRKKFWSFMAKQQERKRTILSEEDQDTQPAISPHANLPPTGETEAEKSSFSTRQTESAKPGLVKADSEG